MSASLAAVAICGLSFASEAQAKTWTVCHEKPPFCDASTIQAAVNDASTGDTVKALEGPYNQQVTVNKPITLEGNPGRATRTVLEFSSSGATLTFTSAASGSTLRHMAVESDGTNDLDDAVDVDGSATITDVSVATTNGYGVAVAANGVTIGPNIQLSSPGQDTDAIESNEALSLTLTGVTASGGSDGADLGAVNPTITDSTFTGGPLGFGLLLRGGGTVRRVTATGGEAGIETTGGVVADSLAIGARQAGLGAAGPLQVRNVTAIATGAGSFGLISFMSLGVTGAITAENVIARGGSSGQDLGTSNGSTIEIGYSNFRGSTGTGIDTTTIGHNQSSDPLFVNGTVGSSQDFHLQNNSPAIGAGTEDVLTGTTDLDGNPRPATGQTEPSLGAYEPTGDKLIVKLAGTGTGAASGAGISCPATCSELFGPGTAVTLTATPSAGSRFAGWSGGCSGAGTCQVTMNSEHTVTATFNAIPPANTAPPEIGGKAALGTKLVASDGSWSGTPTSFAYQWEDCDKTGKACTSIAGATDNSYTLRAHDVGHTLRIVVTASNLGGTQSATSAHTAFVTPAPALSHVHLGPAAFSAAHETTLKLTLSEAATLTVTVTQTRRGHRLHGRCSATAKHGAHCLIDVRRAKRTLHGSPGSDRFDLLLRGLAPGRYIATIVARAAGKSSKPIKVAFTIKR